MPFPHSKPRPPLADLVERLVSEISETGPLPFSAFVDRALYDREHGFYAMHGQAGGRRGDFITSVEIGPLFAAVIGDWLDIQWNELGRPTPFRVAEVGAGVGTLFRGIARSAPACFHALSYTLVERSASMRGAHETLPSTVWQSADRLPDERQHVVMANELLDNLAFDIAERVDDGWANVCVDHGPQGFMLRVDGHDPALDHLTELAPVAAIGSRVPVATHASVWVSEATARSERVLIFDYGATTAELADRGHAGWLRTYVGHQRGTDPLSHIGLRDITHDVPIDQLAPATSQATQADWLQRHGVSDRVESARQTWTARAHIGDLQAIAARSAIGEAEALCDPAGLGAFVVLEWRS